MTRRDEVLARLDEVLSQGEEALATNDGTGVWVEQREAMGFLARAEVVASDLLPPKHPYRARLEAVKGDFIDLNDVGSAIGVVESLRADIAGGYMQRYADLVSAEIFGDFLDMADHLIEQGYKDPAASLVGAVLEDGLRRIADKEGVTVRGKDDLNSLNSRLADAGTYNDFVRKQIGAWADVRNNADHGRFDAYEERDVKGMAAFARTFLSERLG